MPQTTLTYLIEMRARDARRETAALGRDAKSTARDLDQAGDQARDLGRKSASASRDVRLLGRNLRTVGAGLSGFSAGAGRSTRAIGGLVSGLSAAAASGGPALLAVAALTGGLVAAGVAAVATGKSIADATANAREYSARLSEIPSLASVVGVVPEETLRGLERASQSGAALKTTVQAVSLAFAEEFAPEIEAASLLVVSLGLIFADFARSGIEKIRAFMQSIEAMGPIAKRMLGFVTAGISDQIREISTALETGEFRTGSYLDRARGLISTMEKTETATKGATSAIKAQAEELSALAVATAEFEAAHGGRDDSILTGSPSQSAADFLASLGVGNQLSATDRAQLDEIQLLTYLTRDLITAEQYEAGVAAISRTLEETAAAPGPSARERLSPDQIGEVLSAAGGAAGGDLLSLLSLAGPVGSGVGSLVGGIASLGGSGGSEAVAAELEEFREDLLLGIRELPELFAEVIPDFARALAEELPAALLEVIPDLLAAIGDLMNPVSQAQRVFQGVEGLDIPIVSEVGGFLSDSIDFVRGIRDQLFGGSKDSGGHIGKPGYYFLHPGEEVVRSNGQSSQRARSGGSGASVRIDLRAPSMFPFLVELERATGPGGLREGY